MCVDRAATVEEYVKGVTSIEGVTIIQMISAGYFILGAGDHFYALAHSIFMALMPAPSARKRADTL